MSPDHGWITKEESGELSSKVVNFLVGKGDFNQDLKTSVVSIVQDFCIARNIRKGHVLIPLDDELEMLIKIVGGLKWSPRKM